MGKKYTQFTEDTAPTDDDILLGVDVTTGQSKRHTRANLLTGNPIVDPTITGSVDGEIFKGKYTGWIDSNRTVSVHTNDGQRQHVLKVAGVDVTSQIYAGMKGKITRNTSPSTQCTDLEKTTLQQYWNKSTPAGISFIDDYTLEAFIKPESLDASMMIVSRHDGSTGFWLQLGSDGRIVIRGQSGSGAREGISRICVPLNRWSHVAASWDLSAGSAVIHIDGVSVPVSISGTAITSLTQAGNLMVGYSGAGAYFDGKISEVRIWNSVRTSTQIRDNMNQALTGSESNLVGYWKFNGNGNDSTSNANHLTATGTGTTPTATNADNPFYSVEYFWITKVTYDGSDSYITVFTGTRHQIPNQTLLNFYYSPHANPAGFPAKNHFRLASYVNYDYTGINFGATNQWTASDFTIDVPVGPFKVGYKGNFNLASSVSGTRDGNFALAPPFELTNNVRNNNPLIAWVYHPSSADGVRYLHNYDPRELTTMTRFYMYANVNSASGAETWQIRGAQGLTELYAEINYP